MKGDRLTRKARYGIMAALITGTFSIMPMVQALPVKENPGAASITKTGSVMGISSNAANNLITWQSFSIGKNEQVNFDNHNYLNYVTGNMRSDILGSLTGGGNVYLVNPNGIVIGDDAQINVGSLHLSTAELSGAVLNNFDSAVSVLNGAVTPKGDVINKGNLHAAAITVQGENITFKNVAEVDATEVTLNAVANGTVTPIKASGEIHLGYKDADGDYSTVAEPSLDGWTLNGDAYKYMLVETSAELQNLNTNLSGNYMLANDIILPAVAQDEANFVPIGGKSPYFTGRFDGLYHTIESLVIVADSAQANGGAGLFGNVTGSGLVENVGLLNSNVKYTYMGSSVGGIVGECTGGTVRNVYNIGDVEGPANSWSQQAGGIAGRILGDGIISNVFHRGTVTSRSSGGVVGMTSGNAVLINAYHEGPVIGNACAGGIVGEYYGGANISNVYNVGDVTTVNGTKEGGVLGCKFEYASSNPATAFHEAYYATTDTEGNPINQNVTTNSYSNAKTMEQLMDKDNYSDSWSMDTDGSDSHSTWRIYRGQTTPFLTAFMTPLELSGTTSYELSSVYTGKDILVGQGANGNITVRNVGEYTINDLSSLYSNQQGYNIHVADGTTATLKYTVTPAALTVTAAAAEKVYDGTKVVATIDGSYSVNGLLGSDTYSNPVIAFENKNVGTGKAITISGGNLVDGNNGKNYAVTYIGSSGTITPKALSLDGSVINTTKVYDGTTVVGAQAKLSLTGMVSGDDVSLNVGNIEVEYPDKNAGDYVLTYNSSGAVSLVGGDAGNYTITGELSNAAGTGTILPKELSVTIDNISKAYDGTVAATPGNVQLTGIIGNDDVGLASGISAQFVSKNAGNRSVNYSGMALAGNDAGNYALANHVVGQGTIMAAAVSFKADDFAKFYDGTTRADGATYSLFAGQLFADDQAGKGSFAFADSAVGTGKILNLTKVEIQDGHGGKNYHVTYLPSNNSVIKAKPSPVIPSPPITPVPADPKETPVIPPPKDLPVPQPPKVTPVIPVPKVVPVPPTSPDWRDNIPLMREAMAYQGASLYSNGGGSGKDRKGRFKGIKMEEGLGYYTNNSQLSFLSKGIKAPSAMSFYDILAMWSFTK